MAVQSNDEFDHGTYGPPPDDPMTFDATVEQDASRGRALLALVGVIFVAFGVVVWIAYQQGVRSGQEPGIIQADASPPIKVVPPEDPAAKSTGSQDLVTGIIEGKDPAKIEDVFAKSTPPAKAPEMRPSSGDPASDVPPASGNVKTAMTSTPAKSETPVPSAPKATDSGTMTASSGTAAKDGSASGAAPASGDSVKTAMASKSGSDSMAKVVEVPPAPAPKAPMKVEEPAPKPAAAAKTPEPAPTKTAMADPAPKAPAASGEGAYGLQLASFQDAQQAADFWDKVAAKHKDTLAGLKPRFEVVQIPNKGTYHRLIVGPFADKDAAAKTCSTLKANKQDCLVRKNG